MPSSDMCDMVGWYPPEEEPVRQSYFVEYNPKVPLLPQDLPHLFSLLIGTWHDSSIPVEIRHLFKPAEED